MYEKHTTEHIQGRRGPWGVHWHTPQPQVGPHDRRPNGTSTDFFARLTQAHKTGTHSTERKKNQARRWRADGSSSSPAAAAQAASSCAPSASSTGRPKLQQLAAGSSLPRSAFAPTPRLRARSGAQAAPWRGIIGQAHRASGRPGSPHHPPSAVRDVLQHTASRWSCTADSRERERRDVGGESSTSSRSSTQPVSAPTVLPCSFSMMRCISSRGGWRVDDQCVRRLPVCVVWAHARGDRGEGGSTCRAIPSAEASPASLRMHNASGVGTVRRLCPQPVRRRRCRAGRSRRERPQFLLGLGRRRLPVEAGTAQLVRRKSWPISWSTVAAAGGI
jgi:hypothetical protein